MKNSVYLRNNTSRQSFTKKFYQNQFIINSTHVQNSGSYIHVHVFNHPDMKMAEQRSNIVTDVSWKKKRRELEEDRKALGIGSRKVARVTRESGELRSIPLANGTA